MFYFKDDKQITVYFNNGDIASWKKDNPAYETVLKHAINQEWIQIEMLHKANKIIMESSSAVINNEGNLEITADNGSCIVVNPDDNRLTKLIKTLHDKGSLDGDISAVKPFLRNCLENPYINAVEEIYEYCKNMDFEITPDGCFLAYKNVRNDLGSIHDAGKTRHAIGVVTRVDFFDTNRQNTCSYGLHFCSKQYLKSYSGEVTIVVKVNPKHVCSIPVDYNFQKGRTTEYLTVGIISKEADLATTNTEEAFNEPVLKSKSQSIKDRVAGMKVSNRIRETADNMRIYKDNAAKVAAIMGLNIETVRRNMRKYRESI